MYLNDLYLSTLVQDRERAIAQLQLERAALRAARAARPHRRPFSALVTHVRDALQVRRTRSQPRVKATP